MDILFVTSDPALASAVKGTLESARHTVSAASDVDSLAGAWPHGTPMDLVIIDDLSAHDLLDETRRSLSRLMDGKAGDGTGTAVRPRTLLLSTPPRTPKANPDDTPQVRRQTPLPTIRKTGRAKADGQAARPAAPPSSLDGASSVPPIHADETIVKPFSDAELLSYVRALESGGAADETTLIHGDLMLDTRNRHAQSAGVLSQRQAAAGAVCARIHDTGDADPGERRIPQLRRAAGEGLRHGHLRAA